MEMTTRQKENNSVFEERTEWSVVEGTERTQFPLFTGGPRLWHH